ncbi:hypothetical protein [Streptomyces poriticola]|uniref:hypothetical protein n=1 Tax=Streptomyces poriticola TaxID=3120506 RepID=UPI002FCE4C4A
MGSLKVTLCAGAALAAVLTPTAYATDGGGVTVTPARPAPGTDVTLRVADCTEKTAVAVSVAFVSDARLTFAGTDGALVGAGRVRNTVTAGAYAVKVRCGTAEHTGTLNIAEKHHPSTEADPYARPSAPSSPVAPVDAGGGGTARLAAADGRGDDARAEGPGTAHAVTGLILAGVAAVAVALRSARRSRGTD